jgi:hypothetical protein
MDRLARDIDDVRRKWVPDPRLGVFEITPTAGVLAGATTSRDALDALRRLAATAGLAPEIRLLPSHAVGTDAAAIVTAALAPLLAEPQLAAPRASEALHGEILEVLDRQDSWLRVRARDGYVAWTHGGYLATGSAEWAADWGERATARSVAAEIQTRDGVRRRLPTGACLALRRGGVELSDGSLGSVAGGAVRPDAELRAEARHLAPPELARKWYGGAPYLWGGRTEWGLDCSGLVQSVYAARGVRLPRDSDQQYGAGEEVAMSADGGGYEGGDLLFFAERGRVSHVALWAGAGRIVHSAVSRGGVGDDHLFGPEPRMVRLRETLVGVRRVLHS